MWPNNILCYLRSQVKYLVQMYFLTCLHQFVLMVVTSDGRGGDPWTFSRKGKLGGSEVFIGGYGGRQTEEIHPLFHEVTSVITTP